MNEQINADLDFTVLTCDSKSIILRRSGRIYSFKDLDVHYVCYYNSYKYICNLYLEDEKLPMFS